jgi:hypothetical protein
MGHRDQQITSRTVAEIALYEPQSTTGGGGGVNDVFDHVQTINNANTAIDSDPKKNVLVVLSGLVADHVNAMPLAVAMNIGQRWTFVDGDGTLGSGFTWTINGNGTTINGLASFVLAAGTIGASPGGGIGPHGSITLEYTGTELKVVG